MMSHIYDIMHMISQNCNIVDMIYDNDIIGAAAWPYKYDIVGSKYCIIGDEPWYHSFIVSYVYSFK